MRYIARVAEREFTVDVEGENAVTINGQAFRLDMQKVVGEQIYSLLLSDHSYEIFVNRTEAGYDILVAGERHEVAVEDEYTRRIAGIGGKAPALRGDAPLKAPMPGLVVAVKAAEGETVQRGQGLVILEAMKMENELRAPFSGTIKQVKVTGGQKVDEGQTLMILSAEPTP